MDLSTPDGMRLDVRGGGSPRPMFVILGAMLAVLILSCLFGCASPVQPPAPPLPPPGPAPVVPVEPVTPTDPTAGSVAYDAIPRASKSFAAWKAAIGAPRSDVRQDDGSFLARWAAVTKAGAAAWLDVQHDGDVVAGYALWRRQR